MYDTKDDLYFRMDATQGRINAVLDYINSNPDSDPNAYEMNELMFSVAEIGHKGRNFEAKPYEFLKDEKYSKLRTDFYSMMRYRMEQLKSPEKGLISSEEDPLYKYFDDSLYRMATLNSLGDKQVSDIYSKACGISLFIRQRNRDLKRDGNEEIIYDNKNEFIELLDKIDELEDKSSLQELKPLMEDIHMALDKTPKEYYEAIKLKRQQEVEERVMKEIREKEEQEKRKKDDPDDPII